MDIALRVNGVEVVRAGSYAITLHLAPQLEATAAHLAIKGVALAHELDPRAAEWTLEPVALTPGPGRLEAWIARGDKTAGALWVEVKRLD